MEALQVISPHLTEDFLSLHLSKWFNQEVQYSKHEFGEGTGKGDSYLSDVYRITFHGRIVSPTKGENPNVSIRVIVKTLPSNIARRKTFRSTDFFSNEISFYVNVLPKLMEFQATKDVTEPFNYCPKLFAAIADGQSDFLALEDLSVYNYGSAARQEGIDYDHAKVILECFAKFHAISFAYKNQRPQEFEELSTKVFEVYYDEKYWGWYQKFWRSLCACVIDAVEKEYPNSIYVDKIKEFAKDETFFNSIKAAQAGDKTAVFSHGDSWTPNFLFRYKPDCNVPDAAKMIDFQLTRCASPILDIGFFIYACSTQELRKDYYHKMLKYYHDILTKQIKELGSDPEKVYPWSLFMEEVKKYSYFGLAFCMESTPTIILDPEDAFDMESLQGTEAGDITDVWIVKLIKKQSGRLRLAGNVVHAVDNGYI